MSMRCGNRKLIADASNGLYSFPETTGVFEFSTQTADVHIKAAIEGVQFSSKNCFSQSFSVDDLSDRSHERL